MNLLDYLIPGRRRRLSVVLQTQAAECGLAALCMIASHHGYQTTMPELRRQFQISAKGVNLVALTHIASRLSLSARAVRVELTDLVQLKLPCILHWNMDHFVVLQRVTSKMAWIIDPAYGERAIPLNQVSAHFTGIALELTPTAEFSRQVAAPHVRIAQLTGTISGLGWSIAQILTVSLAIQMLVLIAPLFMQWTLDHALHWADRDLMWTLAAGFLLVMLLNVALTAVRSLAVIYLSTTVSVQWNLRVLAQLLRLPMDWFEKRHLGDVVSRFGSIQDIQRTLSTSFIEAIVDGCLAIITLGLMLFYSAALTAISMIAVVLYLVARGFAFSRLRALNGEKLACAARQQSHLFETICGAQTVRLTAAESTRRTVWHNLMMETVRRELALAGLEVGFGSINALIFGTERILTILLGAMSVLDGALSVGMLVAFIAYKEQFAIRTSALVDKWIEFRMLRLHGERLADIVLSAPDEIFCEHADARPIDKVDLEVKNLYFRYSDSEPWIIQSCSFKINTGESVAIVGPSGCGKTTLAKLMLGLLSPTDGCIQIGGMELRRVDSAAFRQATAAVMQDDQLFAGSIADNICFSAPGNNALDIESAARLSGIHDEIVAMPMGYNTLIGDMGTALSGGQKQRVILARALFRKPRLLVLDEATSHLDLDREQSVNESIKSLQVTRIIIAHRPDTIASADRILLLNADGLREISKASWLARP